MSESEKSRRRRIMSPRLRWLLAVFVVAAIAVPCVVWRVQIVALFNSRARLADALRQAGPWGPLFLMGLVIAQVIAAPIPGQAINFAAGYLYGFWLGGLYSWLGLILGSTLAILLARLLGRPMVNRLCPPDTLARLDRAAEGQGLRFFFLIWLLPFLPDDLACFLAGLTTLPLRALILVAALGRLPGVITSVWLGAYAEQLNWQVWLAIAVVSLAGLLLIWRCGDRLQDALIARARH